jgi:hypothetical protein
MARGIFEREALWMLALSLLGIAALLYTLLVTAFRHFFG